MLAKVTLYCILVIVALTALACASVAAVTPVIDEERFAYTGFLSMILLALAAPMAVVLHRPRFRLGGAAFTLLFLGMWAMLSLMFIEWADSERTSMSLMICLIVGIPTAAGFICVAMPWGKWFGWTLGIAGSLLCFAAWLQTWVMPTDNLTQHMIWYAYLILYVATGAALLINVGRRDRRYFRWLGVVLALVALVARLRALWLGDPQATGDAALDAAAVHHVEVWKLTANLAWVTAAGLAFINMLLMTSRPGLVRWLKWISIAFVSFITAATILFYVQWFHSDSSAYATLNRQVALAVLLLTEGAIVCFLIARTILRLKPKAVSFAGVERLEVTCPICALRQEIPLDGACRGCLLKFRIQLTEPHCPACDHMLIRLTSDRCPECGTAIARPAAPAPPVAPNPQLA